jgi:hypothetical protein
MLNLNQTIKTLLNYNIQRDLIVKSLTYLGGVFIFLETIRSQVTEINLLQLVPGLYFFLLFLSLLFLVSFSTIYNRLSLQGDSKKERGTKTNMRMKIPIVMKTRFFLFSLLLGILSNTVLPLSLDSFTNYGEKTLENVWSFEEIINLESLLVSLILSLSQSPTIALFYFTTEKDILFFPSFWKIAVFFIFVGAGVLTPTIDGYTQVSFAFSGIFLYLFIILTLQKRVTRKISFFTPFGS